MSLPWERAKDPDEVLDYGVDWSGHLDEGDTISTSTWTVPGGITKDSDSKTTSTATIRLSGGTAGATYDLTNHIVAASGQEYDQTCRLRVRDR